MATKATTPMTGLLTVEQCAEVAQCSAEMVKSWIKTGRLARVLLTAREVGGQRGESKWRVRPDTLDAFLKSLEAYEAAPGTAAARPPVVLPMATGTDGKSRLKPPRGHGR